MSWFIYLPYIKNLFTYNHNIQHMWQQFMTTTLWRINNYANHTIIWGRTDAATYVCPETTRWKRGLESLIWTDHVQTHHTIRWQSVCMRESQGGHSIGKALVNWKQIHCFGIKVIADKKTITKTAIYPFRAPLPAEVVWWELSTFIPWFIS